jgi:hypothetical protein
MPRIGRLHIPGGYYHLMGRGLERRFIFSEDADKHDFLARLKISQPSVSRWIKQGQAYCWKEEVSFKAIEG